MTERVLIYRLGSLGDTVVALPALHLVARAFPMAERRVLTNFPVSAKAPTMAAVLAESGLVHGYFRYPLKSRSPAMVLRLRREIADWRPDTCVYMAAPRGRRVAFRDSGFLRLCGVRRIIGAPLTAELQNHTIKGLNLWESEADRLVRCLAPLGDARADRPESWDLKFSSAERHDTEQLLRSWPGAEQFISFSVGAKAEVKDWGDQNWAEVFDAIGSRDLGLVLIGAESEAERSAQLTARWPGPVLNLCGRVGPRVSALVMARAIIFLGHDSGPMHLAAAVGTHCVAVFSARARPGVWFPFGEGHDVFYNMTACFNCGLEQCVAERRRCIASIRPAEVIWRCRDALQARSRLVPAGPARGNNLLRA